jgi:large subunit ribosomal protein LP2
MKYVAAYLLLVVGGNASPSVEEVSSVITACGGEADATQIEALIAGLFYSFYLTQINFTQ